MDNTGDRLIFEKFLDDRNHTLDLRVGQFRVNSG